MIRRSLKPAGQMEPMGAYSDGVSVDLKTSGKLIFVTGQVACDASGAVVAREDAAAQTEFVFDRIEAVLGEAGAQLADLVSISIFLTDMADFPAVSAVRNRRLAEARPASTLVEVSRLAIVGLLVEINGIAAMGNDRDVS